MRHSSLPKPSNNHLAKISDTYSNHLAHTLHPDNEDQANSRKSQQSSKQLVYPMGSYAHIHLETTSARPTGRKTASFNLLKKRLLEYDIQTLQLRDQKYNEFSWKPKISSLPQASVLDRRMQLEQSHKKGLRTKNYSISRLEADRPETQSPAMSASKTHQSTSIAPFHRKHPSDPKFGQTVRYVNEPDAFSTTAQTADRFILPQFKGMLRQNFEPQSRQVTRVFPSHV